MNQKRIFICFAAFVVLCVGCEQQVAKIEPSGEVIKIGVIAPFSGSDFSKGKEGLKGAQIALKMQSMLANGDRIEIVLKDDQDDPAKSIRALEELIETDKVTAVLTLSSSGPVLAMDRIADRYQTPILAGLATHSDITKNSAYVSQACFDNALQGQVAALFIRDELLVDKVAVFISASSYYSRDLATEFIRGFIAVNGEITDQIVLTEENPDLSEMMKAIREKDPELLYLPVDAKDAIAVIQKIHEMGWTPKLMASDGLLATVFSQYNDQIGLLDGLLATDFFHTNSRGTSFFDRVRKIHKGQGTSYAAIGLECLSILISAMDRCDAATNKACINRQIRSTTDFEGILGNISIDSTGKARRPVIVNAIKNGKLRYIAKVY